MLPDYPLETTRLLLRPFTTGDLADYAAYRTHPDVNRYLLNKVTTHAAAADLLAAKAARTSLTPDGQALSLAVFWPEANRVVGDVVFKWLSEEHRQGEIGYVFNPEFGGRGLAGEAAGELLRFGFEELGLHRIVAQANPENVPSWRLMERLGMRKEAYHRQNLLVEGEWLDLVTYSVLAREWRDRAKPSARASVLLTFGWYDGPIEGVVVSAAGDACWYFKLVAERFDPDQEDDRLFGLWPVPAADGAVLVGEFAEGADPGPQLWPVHGGAGSAAARAIVEGLLSAEHVTPHLLVREPDFAETGERWEVVPPGRHGDARPRPRLS
ncbi:hypothetical protein BBK82_10285 [Lentzea guizhouensis]|uniref:N-acetyltransferase domain-containing protein n=1 Tax=Lentzea guizhouensis TaxID=1586287 RepID=A0A1B2HF95_9PSEU|nr:GNAT family protein [Lentzea guizhouensis]ANZ36391.1 hypothetical protein BBK82_10285 [Lentzea guizhouensis]